MLLFRLHRIVPIVAALLVAAPALGGEPIPAEFCGDPLFIAGDGVFFFDNSSSTTDGPDEPACLFFGETQIANDLWYCWTSPCAGDVTVETCGLTSVDTKIAVYDGCGLCPPDIPITCNDDACSLQSQVQFAAEAGQQFLIRLGTYPDAAGGVGEFSILCEPIPTVDVTITQLSFFDAAGIPELPFSDYGQLHLTIPGPADGQILWANATIDGVWAIQNAPIIQIEGEGIPQTYTIDFRITDNPGLPVPVVDVQIEIVELQLVSAPVVPVITIPVAEHIYAPGSALTEPALVPAPRVPPPAQNHVNPAAPATWREVRLRGVPGIDESLRHCTPGSFARLLDWMNHEWCLGMTKDDNNDVQDFYDKLSNNEHMDTNTVRGTYLAGRGPDNTWDCGHATYGKMQDGLEKFITDKGLAGKVELECNLFKTQDDDDPAFTPCDVFDALDRGKAVVVQWGYWPDNDTVVNGDRNEGHSISVVGASKCGENVTIFYRDDVNGDDTQDDGNADDGVKIAKFVAEGTSGWTLQGNRWEGFVTLCPTLETMFQALEKTAAEEELLAGLVQDALDEGLTPDPIILEDILDRAVLFRDAICRLFARVQALDPPNPQALGLVQRLKQKAINLKILAEFLRDKTSQNTLDAFDMELQQILAQLGDLGPLLVSSCAGDTDGDNDVDVDDLNNVFLDWNTDGSANGGDITGALPGSPPDGVVDVNDLNAVIVNWGQCP